MPIGIGGVIGGVTSEISASTTRVLLEAAYFTPMAIARTSKRLNLRSEASARFDRGCDPEGIDRAVLRLCELLGATAGDRYRSAQGVIDVSGTVPTPTRVRVRPARINTVLGSDLTDDQVIGYLEPLGFVCERESTSVLDVTVPTFAPTPREIDVIEEVARHHGYANLPRRRPFSPQVGRLTRYQRERRLVREVVAGAGAHEAWTPSLLGPDAHRPVGMENGIRVTNPLTPEESVLRQSLLPGMLGVLVFNADRRQGEMRLFEVGHVFPLPGPERVSRALARSGETVITKTRSSGWHWHGRVTMPSRGRAVSGVDRSIPDRGRRARGGRIRRRPGVRFGSSRHAPDAFGALVLAGRDRHARRSVGVVGEVDPDVLVDFGLDGERRRVGWLDGDRRAAHPGASGTASCWLR